MNSGNERDDEVGLLTPNFGLVYGGNATSGAAGASRDQLTALDRSRSETAAIVHHRIELFSRAKSRRSCLVEM